MLATLDIVLRAIQTFAVIAAVTVCRVASAQGNDLAKASYSNVTLKESYMRMTAQNLSGNL